MEAQPINTTTQATPVDDAALAIYESLTKEGFGTEDKIAILKAVGGLIKTDIDINIKQLQSLKLSF